MAPRARSETPLDEYRSTSRSHITMAAGQSGVQTRSEERWSRSAVTYESDWNGTGTLSPLRALQDGTSTAVDVVVCTCSDRVRAGSVQVTQDTHEPSNSVGRKVGEEGEGEGRQHLSNTPGRRSAPGCSRRRRFPDLGVAIGFASTIGPVS